MTNKDGSETIRVLPATKQRLKSLASTYGESMDDIIQRLLPKEKKQKEAASN